MSRQDLTVTKGWRSYEPSVKFLFRSSLFVPKDVVPGEIWIGVRRPDQIHKLFLSWTRGNRLQAARYRRRENIVRKNPHRCRVISLELLLRLCVYMDYLDHSGAIVVGLFPFKTVIHKRIGIARLKCQLAHDDVNFCARFATIYPIQMPQSRCVCGL